MSARSERFILRSTCYASTSTTGAATLFFFHTTGSQALRFIARGKLFDKLIDAAIHYGRQVVNGETNAMVGDAVLWVVIGADFFRAVAGTHLRTAIGLQFC